MLLLRRAESGQVSAPQKGRQGAFDRRCTLPLHEFGDQLVEFAICREKGLPGIHPTFFAEIGRFCFLLQKSGCQVYTPTLVFAIGMINVDWAIHIARYILGWEACRVSCFGINTWVACEILPPVKFYPLYILSKWNEKCYTF